MMDLLATLALSRLSCTLGLSVTFSTSLLTSYIRWGEFLCNIHVICCQLTRQALTRLLAHWIAFATATIICGFSFSKLKGGLFGCWFFFFPCSFNFLLFSASSAAAFLLLSSISAISLFLRSSLSLLSTSASRCSRAIRASRARFRSSASALAAARSV